MSDAAEASLLGGLAASCPYLEVVEAPEIPEYGQESVRRATLDLVFFVGAEVNRRRSSESTTPSIAPVRS